MNGLDLEEVFSAGQARAHQLAAGWAPARPDATPLRELTRSPAASRIAEHATRAGLFSFHFEHRTQLPLPAAWLPAGRHDVAELPAWERGVLPEAKYQSFRHDLAIGSFHPHHRAKWSTHELCHGLVGFAWRSNATPFFHACAGRLAELLPVALWYFFDEAFLVRCPDHAGDGDTFRTVCPACEASAAALPNEPSAREHLAAGLRFVDKELAALARSARLGRPIPHRWATIDLCSDGVAYADAHAARLGSAAFASWWERFAVPGGGASATLEDLEERVVAVLRALLGLGDPPSLAPSPAHGRARWIAQDLGWRALHAASCAGAPARRAITGRLDGLAAVVLASRSLAEDAASGLPEAISQLTTGWPASAQVTAEDVLATGYALPGRTVSSHAAFAGLEGALPVTTELFGRHLHALVASFVAQDALERAPLARRFAAWIASAVPASTAELVAVEAALVSLPEGRAWHLAGPPADARLRLGAHASVFVFQTEAFQHLERAEQGDVELDPALGLRRVEGPPLGLEPSALVIGRDAEGEVMVLDLDPDTAAAIAALGEGAVPALPADELAALVAHGVLEPVAWTTTLPGTR